MFNISKLFFSIKKINEKRLQKTIDNVQFKKIITIQKCNKFYIKACSSIEEFGEEVIFNRVYGE